MRKIKLPARWAKALITGDFSGLSSADRRHIENGQKRLRGFYCAGFEIIGEAGYFLFLFAKVQEVAPKILTPKKSGFFGAVGDFVCRVFGFSEQPTGYAVNFGF